MPESNSLEERRNYGKASRFKTTVEHIRLLMEVERCEICGKDFNEEHSRNKHIDHNHDTDQIRGVLCASCNVKLGYYEKNYHKFDAFQRYLDERDLIDFRKIEDE